MHHTVTAIFVAAKRCVLALSLICLCLLLFSPLSTVTLAQSTVDFGASGLSGLNDGDLVNPTSLQFGPDGRLYISQKNGLLMALTVERTAANQYTVVARETIDLVQTKVPNHDDDGTRNTNSNERQVTGILVVGTSTSPVLYVTSSDPRIGAGSGGSDKGLDTNSGVISRLTWTGQGIDDPNGSWDKVDIVRGLPRSEENHASNGLQIDEASNMLYLAQGGHTNAGAPSNNFAFTTEYALAAAILKIDLDAIESMPVQEDNALYSGYTYKWIYDLPTVDDPTRNNVNGINNPDAPGYDGVDPGDPFGGNDGLNQAKLVAGGPVQIHSPGYRNLYDIVITSTGRMYGVDNGANKQWGGHVAGEVDYPTDSNGGNSVPGTCTNDYIEGEPGSTDTGPGGDDVVNNKNGLHYVRPLVAGEDNFYAADVPYYAGHPTAVRGNPSGAGLYTKNSLNPNGFWRTEVVLDANGNPDPTTSLPVDWATIVPEANPVECDFRNSGQTDNALANFQPSTNGITEYTATNFDGAMTGDLLAAGFNGTVYQITLSEDGKTATNCPAVPSGDQTVSNCTATFANNFGSSPLDIVAQGDDDVFGGTVWAATYGSNDITIFEPADYDGNDVGVCDETYSTEIDSDNDGYSNADEIDNGANPCSGADVPADFDKDFLSNLNDTDDDGDTLLDTVDPFVWDANNGLATTLPGEPTSGGGTANSFPLRYEFFNSTSFGFFGIGFTGLMMNGSDYLDLLDEGTDQDKKIVAGGTAGLLTIESSAGDPTQDTQTNAFQLGLNVDESTPPFIVRSVMSSPFFGGSDPVNYMGQGIYIGTGDQDNYLKVILRGNSSGNGIQAFFQSNGTTIADQKVNVEGILNSGLVEVRMLVDPAAGTVQPQIALGSTKSDLEVQDIGTPIALEGAVLDAVKGTHTVNGVPTGLAAGIIHTSFPNASNAFLATWDYLYIEEAPSEAQAIVSVETNGLNGSTFGGGFSVENTSAGEQQITGVRFDLSTAMIPDIVFDPDGGAGDGTAKGFSPTSASAGLVAGHTFTSASEGGYYGLDISTQSFGPGQTLGFAVDVDPTSIKGGSAPGPNESGSVSGLELAGATVTVDFDNGESHTVELFRGPNGTLGGSTNLARSQIPTAPSIEVQGLSTPSTTFEADQAVRVTAPAGQEVVLLQFEGGMFVEDLTGPYAGVGFDVEPYEMNSIIAVSEQSATVGSQGYVDFDVTLTKGNPEAGLNYFAAVVRDTDGTTSDLSETAVVEYDPNAAPDVVVRINAGGAAYTDGNGDVWEADDAGTSNTDDYVTGGTKYPNNPANIGPIANTEEDLLFKSERYGGKNGNPFFYEIPVPAGTYTVNLYFAEIYLGVNTNCTDCSGLRVFNVNVESGQGTLSNFDVFAEAGASLTAVTKSFSGVEVSDGNMTIDFAAIADNAKISAIEIISSGSSPANQPPQVSAIDDQVSAEGDESTISIAATDPDNDNLDYSAVNLPPGLDVEPTNGQIFGVIADGAAANSPYAVTVTVSDGTDEVSTSFQWTVEDADETVNETVAAGGTVTTDTEQDGATADDPLETSVQLSAGGGGAVSLIERNTTQTAPNGFTLLGQEVAITAPAGSTDDPLILTFTLDASLGVDTDVVVFKDGVAVGTCDEALGTSASPDPCVGSVVASGDDVVATVRSSTASVWTFGIRQPPAATIVSPQDGAVLAGPSIPLEWTTTGVLATDHVHVTIEGSDYVGSQPLNGSYVFENVAPGTYDLTVEVASEGHVVYTNPEATQVVTVTVVEPTEEQVLFRVNTGGSTLAASDGPNPDWSTDTNNSPSVYLVEGGANVYNGNAGSAYTGPVVRDASLPSYVPDALFETERYDVADAPEMAWSFPVESDGEYAVRLYFAELFSGVDAAGERVFDVEVEGAVPAVFTNIDPFSVAGAKGGFMLKHTVTVTDGSLDLTFLHKTENPALKGIEISAVSAGPNQSPSFASLVGDQTNEEGDAVSLQVPPADDPNGDVLTYAATGLPGGLSIDGATGLISGTIGSGGAFQEANGLVVIEMESGDFPSGWAEESTFPNASDGSYLRYAASNNLSTPGTNIITYEVEIQTPGLYQFQWRNRIGQGSNSTEHNDSWLKINADAFYGQKGGGSVVCPQGYDPSTNDCTGSAPEGAGAGGWFKVYLSGSTGWTWSTNTSDNDAHSIYARFDAPGVYTVQVSGRSQDHVIDRMVLAKTDYTGNPQDLSVPESATSVDVAANSPYAVTVTATDPGGLSAEQSFQWTVTEPSGGDPAALVEINPGGGLGASTYSGSSFQVTNQSTGALQITGISFDLSTGILPDMVFDPVGSGGDATSSCLTPNTGAGTVGLVAPADPCVDPFSQPREGGFDVLTVSFSDFGPSEFFAFTTDVDPNSIQGVSGAGNAGAVSGFELIGSTVTVTFSDGSALTGTLYEDGSLGGAQVVLAPEPTQTPSISAAGVAGATQVVSEAAQTIVVSGTPGDHVSLLQVDGRLFIASGDPPYNVTDETFYANEAMAKALYTAVIGTGGTVEIPVTLLETAGANGTPDGGINHFVAVTSAQAYAVDQPVSTASNRIVLTLGEPAAATAAVSGTVSYYEGTPLADATLDATPLAGGTATGATTGSDGSYGLTLATNESFELTASGAASAQGGTLAQGITTLDLSLIRQHILQVNTLDAPEKVLAADFNLSNSVTTTDISAARGLILGLANNTQEADLWGCVVAGSASEADPFSAASAYTYDPLIADQAGQDFTCYRRGDVNGSYFASSTQQALATAKATTGAKALSAQGPAVRLAVAAQELAVASSATPAYPADAQHAEVLVPIEVESGFQRVGGVQFTLEWDARTLEFAGVEAMNLSGMTPAHFGLQRTKEGLLSFAWDDPSLEGQTLSDGSTLFALRFRVKGDAGQQARLGFSSSVTALGAHRVGSTLTPAVLEGRSGELALVELPNDFALKGNYPNPFRGQTQIAFDLPEQAEVSLEVYDLLGRRVMQSSAHEVAAGSNRTLQVNATRLPSGAYFYRLTVRTASGDHLMRTGRMTVVN